MHNVSHANFVYQTYCVVLSVACLCAGVNRDYLCQIEVLALEEDVIKGYTPY